MKLTNRTDWRTDQLRALIYEVCRRELLSTEFTKRLDVTAKYGRAGRGLEGYGGYAYYNSRTMCLKLPRHVEKLDTVKVAKIIAHELAHCQGVRHGGAMRNVQYGWVVGWRDFWGWAASWPVGKKAEPVKPTRTEKVEKRLDECRKSVAKWQRKLQFAKTWLRKWQRKMNRLESTAAALKDVKE